MIRNRAVLKSRYVDFDYGIANCIVVLFGTRGQTKGGVRTASDVGSTFFLLRRQFFLFFFKSIEESGGRRDVLAVPLSSHLRERCPSSALKSWPVFPQ